MTNQEIYRESSELAEKIEEMREDGRDYPTIDEMRLIRTSIRKFVLQAYEEAAKIADSYDTGRNGDMSDMLAADIRALASSLVAETPPSN